MHLITTISRGGAENQLLVLVKEQIRQGLEVHVVYLKGLPELRTELESLGVIVHSELAGAHFIRQTFLLRKIVVGKNAIVHAHLPRSELVAFFSPVSFTFFVTRHNAEPFFPGAPKFLSNSLSKMVSMRCKNFIAISAAVKSFMINRGEIFNPEKIQIVRYGYEQKRNLDAGVGVPTSPLLKLGTVSRLTDQKDIHTMLRAFKLVERKIPDVSLSIVGSGPLESQLKALSIELGLENSVHFLGRTDKIIEFLSGLDVFLLTSKYEGFGLVLLEAMDAGIPIIASRNSAIPEVLGTDFPNLCETGNDEEFAEKILRLNDLEYRSTVLALQANRLVIFDAPSMARKIYEVYFGEIE